MWCRTVSYEKHTLASNYKFIIIIIIYLFILGSIFSIKFNAGDAEQMPDTDNLNQA